MRTNTLWILFAILIVLAQGTARAEDWPTYRHDRMRSAVTVEKLQLPLANVWYFRSRLALLAPKDIPVRETVTRAFGDSSRQMLPEHLRYALPITSVGDSVFFAGSDGRVVCLDAKTGKVRWEFLTGAAITCSPNVSEGKVYVGSDDGFVYCLDAATGKLVWKHKPTPRTRWFISFGRMSSIWPVRTDVLVDKGVAYFGSGIFPHDGMYVNAIDAHTAKRIWQAECYRYGFAGHIFATSKTMILPTELKGFHRYQVRYRRTDGSFAQENDAEYDTHRGASDIVKGLVANDVRYWPQGAGIVAWTAKNEYEKGGKKVIWRQNKPNTHFAQDAIAYAGGVLYVAGNDYQHMGQNQPAKGTGGVIYALDPANGNELWSARIPERTYHIIVANGRLFVSTRNGSIYCFGPKGTPQRGVIDEPVESNPFPNRPDTNACRLAANRILAPNNNQERGVGIEGKGYALVLDCETGALAYELAKRSEFIICAVFKDAAKAKAARERFSRANMHGSRISVWHQEPGTQLPYSPNFADLIVSEAAVVSGKLPKYTPDIERLLKPIRGVALFGGRSAKHKPGVIDQATLKKWAPAGWTIVNQHEMLWAKHVRPPVKNGGGWTHRHGSPGNTMCSHDAALKAPLGMVWYGPPYVSWVRDILPPIIHSGVMVCPTDGNTIEAYDEYNGRFLWRRRAKNIGGRFGSFAAGGGGLLIPSKTGMLRLNIWTGQLVREYHAPFPGATRWGAIAVSKDGKTIWGTGNGQDSNKQHWNGTFALNAETGQTLWKLGGPGQGDKFGGWRAIADGRMYFITGAVSKQQSDVLIAEMKAYLKANDPEQLKRYEQSQRTFRLLTARDAITGKILYQHAVDIANADQWVAAHAGKVIFARRHGAKWWGSWGDPNGREFRFSNIAVHDGATGKLLWKRVGNYRFQPVVTGDTIFAEPWAFDLATGKSKQRSHPITGQKGDWAWVRYDKQCGGYNGSENFLFGRSKGFGYHDVARDRGMYVSWHQRTACNPDASSGGGMMVKAPMNAGCGCPWSLPFTMAMAQLPEEPATPFEFFHKGRPLPVKHLQVNFGAAGDRKDKDGNLWLHLGTRAHPTALQLRFQAPAVYYPMGAGTRWGIQRDGRPSLNDAPAENTSTPFVFATASHGLKRFVVPVTSPADGAGKFTVRLGFCAPVGDKPGQRVFDVRLNGKRVLKNFDIVKAAGAANRAIWKEFNVELDSHLVLGLIAEVEKPTAAQMPLISGMVVRRRKMKTMGFEAPPNIWLGRTKPEQTIKIGLANHLPEAFKGKIVFDTPKGFQVVLPGGDAVELGPDVRKTIAVQLKASGKIKPGSHKMTVKLVSDSGKTQLKRKVPVDWLGELVRKVQYGGSVFKSSEVERRMWYQRVWVTPYLPRLPVSKGTVRPGDDGTAHAYLWFDVPEKVGKIRRVRVQLHVATGLWRCYQGLFGPAEKVQKPSKYYWGLIRQIKGPPWQEPNAIKFPEQPAMMDGASRLEPVAWDPYIVEATVPGTIGTDEKGRRRVLLAIEPTSMNGPIYWSDQVRNRGTQTHNAFTIRDEQAPVLLIDYEPKPPKTDKK